MSNRKTYDKAHDETPETTYMRDVLNTMLDDLLTRKFGIPTCRHTKKTPATRGAPVLKREVNDDGTDALYFANPEHEHKPASAGKRIVMLRQPNTKAADLFDLDVVNKAVSAMKAGEDGEAERKVQQQFGKLHAEMLKGNWAVRDFVGFKEKRLHSNTKLIQILVKHLELDQGQHQRFVQSAKDTATRKIDAARAEEEKHNQELKEALSSVNVKLTQLELLTIPKDAWLVPEEDILTGLVEGTLDRETLNWESMVKPVCSVRNCCSILCSECSPACCCHCMTCGICWSKKPRSKVYSSTE
eukprot:s1502_g2.t1